MATLIGFHEEQFHSTFAVSRLLLRAMNRLRRDCGCLTSSSERISTSAIRNAKVDSAPWFSFTRSGCSPSRQPPVEGSYRAILKSLLPRNQLKADQAFLSQRSSPVAR